MKTYHYLCIIILFFNSACNQAEKKQNEKSDIENIDTLFENYYNERMQLFPLEATSNGENQYNDILPIDIADSYRAKLKTFYEKYKDALANYDREKLNASQKMSYYILKREMEMSIEGLQFHDNYMPINQFWSLPLTMGQLGSGSGNQPFKTVKDYDNFLGRINGFYAWCDTAIVYMQKGMASGDVYPKILVERIIPQMQPMMIDDVKKSVFYTPIKNIPKEFSEQDKNRLTAAYEKAIKEQVIPSYEKLYKFFKFEYMAKAKNTDGIADIPNGKERYEYLVRLWTTTNMTPDEVFELGQSEVKRIRAEMEKIMAETGFKGDLKAFFKYVNTDKKFCPYKTPQEVIQAYNAIHTKMEPQLKKLFGVVPKSKFEVRETEKFREASASAEYNPGAPDGSRPGIFYVPVSNAVKFNCLSMEDLFLHEAIPGHHYQCSLQAENTDLPKFRRFVWYGAYGEGWALYTESLGKELGLYTDPYQYFGSLSEEMHRAIRLVVDPAIHYKGWTREQAIQFSLENEAESEADITTEIERYMAIPGQATAYKVGQLKIIELRKEAEKALGDKFSISKFHDELLNDGCLPIDVLETKMRAWIAKQK